MNGGRGPAATDGGAGGSGIGVREGGVRGAPNDGVKPPRSTRCATGGVAMGDGEFNGTGAGANCPSPGQGGADDGEGVGCA